jgi:hypothetical protein
VRGAAPASCTRRDAALALDPQRRVVGVQARRAADVVQAIDVGDVGLGTEVPRGAVERLDVGDDRAGEQASGSQVLTRSVQESESSGEAAEQLDGLHGHQADSEVFSLQYERTRICADRLDGELPGALAQGAQQLTVTVQRSHQMSTG